MAKEQDKKKVDKTVLQTPALADEDNKAEHEEEESDDSSDDDEEEEEDQEEEEEEEEDQEEEDDDDEEEEAHADDEIEHDEEDDDEPADEDPYWWTPHLVLTAILLLGLGGFLGLFNKWLVPLVASVAPEAPAETAAPAPAPKPAAPAPAPATAKPAVQPATAAPQPAAPTYGAKHILITHKDSRAHEPSKRSKEDAKKVAALVAREAKADKKKWDDLVKKYSEDKATSANHGLLPDIRGGSDVIAMSVVEALAKLKVDEISDPVESPYGYHILWRTK